MPFWGNPGKLLKIALVETSEACAVASLEVALGVTQNLTQQLCEARSVVCLLESIALVSLCYFRIALTVSLTCHGQVHTYLATLTVEVVFQTLDNIFVNAVLVGLAQHVNSSKCHIVVNSILHLLELAGRSLADRTLLWSLSTFVFFIMLCILIVV